jgi:hypothetical protein
VLCTHPDLPIRSMQDFHSQSPQSIKRCSVIMPIGSHEGAPDVWHSSFGLQEFRHRGVCKNAAFARTIRWTWCLAVIVTIITIVTPGFAISSRGRETSAVRFLAGKIAA